LNKPFYRSIRAIFLSLLLALPLSCNKPSATSGKKKPANASIIIAGSTSVQPFAEKLAEIYMVKNPWAIINVQGGGSTAGVRAAQTGIANIGTSSRNLHPEEKGLHEIPIAYDGIAVIVNPGNPLTNLSTETLRKIYAGKILNWKELGGVDHRITTITREEGSGTRGAFEELVMEKTEIDPGCIVEDSNGSVRELVGTDPYAIGYMSFGLVNAQVKAIALDNIMPSIEAMKKKRYRFFRPFLFLTRKKPTGLVLKFIQFVLSKEGQNTLVKEGLIPSAIIQGEKLKWLLQPSREKKS
jgi:phosphate transport system substrate-binding protein